MILLLQRKKRVDWETSLIVDSGYVFRSLSRRQSTTVDRRASVDFRHIYIYIQFSILSSLINVFPFIEYHVLFWNWSVLVGWRWETKRLAAVSQPGGPNDTVHSSGLWIVRSLRLISDDQSAGGIPKCSLCWLWALTWEDYENLCRVPQNNLTAPLFCQFAHVSRSSCFTSFGIILSLCDLATVRFLFNQGCSNKSAFALLRACHAAQLEMQDATLQHFFPHHMQIIRVNSLGVLTFVLWTFRAFPGEIYSSRSQRNVRGIADIAGFWKLAPLSNSWLGLRCFLAVGKHALFLVRRNLGGSSPHKDQVESWVETLQDQVATNWRP